MELSTKELSSLFQVTDRTVRSWATKGMPKIAPGKFDGLEAVRWYAENIFLAEAAESRDLLSRPEAERLQANLKAQMMQLELDRGKGLLVPLEEIKRDWSRIAQAVKTTLYGIPFRLSAIIATTDNENEIRKMIKTEVNRSLDEIAEGNSTCPGCGCKLWPEDDQEAKTDGK